MQPDTTNQESVEFDAAGRYDVQRADVQREASSHPTSQAERAVMHPDHRDPDWHYYHVTWAG